MFWASIFRTARSLGLSVPTNFAVKLLLSAIKTVILSAAVDHVGFRGIVPSALTTTPEPSPLQLRRCGP